MFVPSTMTHKHHKTMKQVTVYTNGKSLFTLENYGKTAGVSHANGVSIHSIVSIFVKRAMHTNGSLHYIIGTGDMRHIANTALSRRNYGPFNVI